MGIIENAKDAIKIVQKIDNIELYRKILDLQSEAMELIEQLKQKDETISKLNTALVLKGKMICESSAYYIVDKEGGKIDGPFCTKCFDVDHVTCRLVPITTPGQGREHVQCPNCKVVFNSWQISSYLDKH